MQNIDNETISGGNGEGVPPVPIPNTEVKPFSAESTWLDTAREDRSSPDSMKHLILRCFFFVDFEKLANYEIPTESKMN